MSRAATSRSERAAWLDLFAGGLERDLSIDKAASAIGKSATWGRTAFNEICAHLGKEQCQ